MIVILDWFGGRFHYWARPFRVLGLRDKGPGIGDDQQQSIAWPECLACAARKFRASRSKSRRGDIQPKHRAVL
jgi:hypothetical protein